MSVADSEPLFEIAPRAGAPAPPSADELQEFRQQVEEWIKMDEQVRKLLVAARERRTKQRALAAIIQNFMISHAYDNLSTSHGRIVSSVRVVKVAAKPAEIKRRLLELQGPAAEPLVRQLFEDDRPTVEKKSLRRIVPKVPQGLLNL
jgi:hypothetical protein